MSSDNKHEARKTILPLKCNNEDFEKIDYLCKVLNISRSEVLRLAVDILYSSFTKSNITALK